MKENVAIIGASDKPDRFSYKALEMLREYGHEVFPIHPRLKEIEGVKCFSSLEELKASGVLIDTVTLYVRSNISSKMKDSINALKPKRVIFNPGTENDELEASLQGSGIEPIEHCTLVMLRTGEF